MKIVRSRYMFSLCGQDGLLISLRQKISVYVHKEVLAVSESVEHLRIKGVEEIVPSYCSILIRFDPEIVSFRELTQILSQQRKFKPQNNSDARAMIQVPVLYGEDAGTDLEEVAKLSRLSCEEVIRYHTSTVFHVFSTGFLPGFPYLGIVPRRIRVPRLENPRNRVQKGAVALAGKQSGIYPVESPGGWRIIGQTPFELFSEEENPPTLFRTGDRVRFMKIDREQFKAIRKRIESGCWMPFERDWQVNRN